MWLPDLEEHPLAEFPVKSDVARAVGHRGSPVQTQRDEVFVIPQDLERDESEAASQVEDHAAFDTQVDRPIHECPIEGREMVESRCFDPGFDLVFSDVRLGRDDARGVEDGGEGSSDSVYEGHGGGPRSFVLRRVAYQYGELVEQDVVFRHVLELPDERVHVGPERQQGENRVDPRRRTRVSTPPPTIQAAMVSRIAVVNGGKTTFLKSRVRWMSSPALG